MGNNILFAVLGLWALCIVTGSIWCRWRGAAIATVVPAITYPGFFVWYLFVQYLAVMPTFAPAGPWKADLYGPWKALAIPALPALGTALVIMACFRNSQRARLKSLKTLGSYLLLSLGSYVVVAIVYAIGNLRGWAFLDAYMSSLQFMLLCLLAVGLGLSDRSATTLAGLLIAALPLWLVGVIVGRWAMLAGAMILSGLVTAFS